MFWIFAVAVIYSAFILLYREARPLIKAGVLIFLIVAPPLLSGFARNPGLEPEEIGEFIADVVKYYGEIIMSFAEASMDP